MLLEIASVVTYPGEYAFRFDGDMVTIESLLKLSFALSNRLSTHAGGRWKYTLNRCGTSRGHGRWGPALTVNDKRHCDRTRISLLNSYCYSTGPWGFRRRLRNIYGDQPLYHAEQKKNLTKNKIFLPPT